jgi:hypothetical protein
MEPYYLTFEHKGEKNGASIEPWMVDATITFEFDGGFFHFGSLNAWTKEEVKMYNSLWDVKHDIAVKLTDNNDFNSYFRYKNGELIDAKTDVWRLITDPLLTINPKRAFAFWISFAEALKANPKTPERFRKNLEAVSQIKTLEAYIEKMGKEKGQSPEELFNENYLRHELPDIADHYLN